MMIAEHYLKEGNECKLLTEQLCGLKGCREESLNNEQDYIAAGENEGQGMNSE